MSYTKWNKPHTHVFFIYSCLIKERTLKLWDLCQVCYQEPKETKYINKRNDPRSKMSPRVFFYCLKILLSLQVSTDFLKGQKPKWIPTSDQTKLLPVDLNIPKTINLFLGTKQVSTETPGFLLVQICTHSWLHALLVSPLLPGTRQPH